MSRVLVSGAAGFVGSAVVRRLVADGADVVAAVRPGSSLERLAPVAGAFELVRGDLRSPAQVATLVERARPDLCLHLAASGAVVRGNDLEELLRVNAHATIDLVRALARVGCRRLVTAGSSSEYGPVDGPMDERRAPAPDDAYGVAKLAGGHLARVTAAPLGLETVHLRLFSVYGPWEDERRLVMSVVRALLAGRPVELTLGRQVRDLVYVDDAADAFLRAGAAGPELDGAVLNVGSGVETSVRDLALAIAGLVGGRHLLRFGARPYRAGERFSWRAATELAEQTLGWHATTPLHEGLAHTIAHAAVQLAELERVAA